MAGVAGVVATGASVISISKIILAFGGITFPAPFSPYPNFEGKKEGLIPGFIEALSLMNYGDKTLVFIPSKLGMVHICRRCKS